MKERLLKIAVLFSVFVFVVGFVLTEPVTAGKPPKDPPSGGGNHLIVVDKDGSGDFTTITDALNSITDASAATPYLVKVNPGIYNETVTMLEYVSIQGSGRNATTITGSAPGTGAVILAGNSELSDLTVTAEFDAFANESIEIRDAAGPARLSNLNVIGKCTGIVSINSEMTIEDVDINVETNACSPWGIYSGGSALTYIDRVKIVSISHSVQDAFGIRNDRGSIVVSNTDIDVSGSTGLNAGLFHDLNAIYTKIHNVSASASGVNSYGLYMHTFGLNPPIIYQSSFSGDSYSLYKLSDLDVYAAGTQFDGAINNSVNNHFVNCFDGNFLPLP